MIKKILVMVVLACFSLTSMFGQNADETWGGGYFSASFDVNTGTLADDTDGGPFSGNAFDLGLEYTKNFSKVPIVDFFAKVNLTSSIAVTNTNIRDTYPIEGEPARVYPKYEMNGATGTSFGLGYMEAGLRVGSWGFFAVQNSLLLKSEIRVPLSLQFFGDSDNDGFFIDKSGLNLAFASKENGNEPLNVSFTLYGGINYLPYRIGLWWNTFPGTNADGTENKGEEGRASEPSVKDLYGGLSLAIGMNWTGLPVLRDMGLTFDASWRTNGTGTGTNAGGSIWLLDSSDALFYNGKLRVQSTLSYTPSKSLSTYVRFRYEYRNILPMPEGTFTRRDRPAHDFYVQGGLTYRFGGEK